MTELLGNIFGIPRADYQPQNALAEQPVGLLDFLSHEAGRERSQTLDNILEHYIPPEMRQQVGLLAMLNPVNEMGEATASSRAAFTDPDNRGKHVVNALTNTVGAAAPMAAAKFGVPVANALADTLLGFAPAANNAVDTARRFAADEYGGLNYTRRPDDYAGWHRAPEGDVDGNATLDALDKIYPDDVYGPKAIQYYGHGGEPWERETLSAIRHARGNPDAEITVYRAVPDGVEDINAGDWVTPNRAYAEMHGDSWVDGGRYSILEEKVRAGDLYTDANSLHEFGWSPSVSNIDEVAQAKAAWMADPNNDALRRQYLQMRKARDTARPKPPEAQRGDEILGLLKSGKGDEVTDEMLDMGDPTLNARLNMYLYDNYDLPMDAMHRHYRASKGGFEIEPLGGRPSRETVYHQTPADIQSFELGRGGDGVTAGHSGGGAIWTSDTPHNIPAAHNTLSEATGEYLDGVNIMPVVTRQSKRVGIDQKWNPDYNINEQFPSVVTMDESARLANEGFTHGSVGIEKAFFNPANIRSRFARFDPRLKHLRNLSASAAGASLLPYLMAEDEQ